MRVSFTDARFRPTFILNLNLNLNLKKPNPDPNPTANGTK